MQMVKGDTRVFGIIGNPVSHTISPLLHNRAFENTGFPGIYVPFAVDRTGPFLKQALLHLGLSGLSVTIPHKIWAARQSDTKDLLVELTGAANTLMVRETRKGRILEGYNTDGPGALRALKSVEPDLTGKTILIAGYGGSARAIVGQILLSEKPERILITGRKPAKIKAFIKNFEQFNSRGGKKRKGFSFRPGTLQFVSDTNLEKERPDIVINTTPLGMKGFDLKLPVPEELIRPGMTVMDIVYVPELTPLLETAKARKARVVPGYMMLLNQAVLQFELFTGQTAGPHIENLMRLTLLTKLRS